ncbi:tryptophan synthase, alpha subunit [Leptospira fainei serovar Hurstbridge str. BUT 6]|uniref:Tryptophan synthase alpha chain n=1 Tax=Leptospira fainei serovar Hurstbridge str. BUT 6 TaxID=1193011 RepID=S3V2U6_9LEPT|nr:tryptophan synthase subunit alpha [Leptospira fainei]EPG74954.1 tryptophan synthase, alpha subunit [Leptospira fainei serovar Hurstbridge str. BUT 6]
MSAIRSVFSETASAFIPYISLGDPDYDSCVDWADALIRGGAGILELGIPFSDPVADGPIIQKAFKRALAHPFSMDQILDTTARIYAKHPHIPLVYLTYFNPIYSYGFERFAEKAKVSGIQGMIIPDLPFDTSETDALFKSLKKRGIDLIHLVTPATPPSRMKGIREFASGFVYYVTSYGVTGERKAVSVGLEDRIRFTKTLFELPVCAGFGISSPEQAKEISVYADGIIIGSAVQRIIEENGTDSEVCKQKLYDYARSISNALRGHESMQS